MKRYKNINLIAALSFAVVSATITSCSNEVDFGEQFKKTVYIVNSNDLLHTSEHFFGARNDEIVISVYVASSEPITSDLKARLKLEPKALDSLNTLNALIDPSYIDKVMLPAVNFQIEGDPEVTIKAGEQYGTLRMPFHTAGLNPDIAYTIPMALLSNSAGFDINPALQMIVYEIRLVNQYSGLFAGISQESPTVSPGVQPVLKAMSTNTVRMPIHTLNDDWQHINTNFMLLTIAENGNVAITPWAEANVTDLGGSFYDAQNQTFELNYQFSIGFVQYTIKQTISKI